MGVLAYDKSCSVKQARIVEVVAVGHTVGVSSGPQTFGGRGGGHGLGRLLVGADVVGGAVEAEGYDDYQFLCMQSKAPQHLIFNLHALLNTMKHIIIYWFTLVFLCNGACCQNLASFTSQNSRYSLTIALYKNNKPKIFRYRQNVHINLRGIILVPKDSAGLLLFQQLTVKDTFDLIVKSRSHVFSMSRIPGWRLQNGAHVSVGVLKNFKNLQSIAEQDDYKTEDENYETWSKRYRIAPEGSTLDLENAKSILTVHYLVLLPIMSGDGAVFTSHQIKRKHL